MRFVGYAREDLVDALIGTSTLGEGEKPSRFANTQTNSMQWQAFSEGAKHKPALSNTHKRTPSTDVFTANIQSQMTAFHFISFVLPDSH